MKPHKYGAVATEVDGHRFPSKREARRYSDLKLLLRAGEIEDLELQPKFPISVNGHAICEYRADFRYRNRRTQITVVEDSKGVRTPEFIIKKKLVLAVHGVSVVEV